MKFTDVLIKIVEIIGIDTGFGVTGGYAMHINESFANSNIIKKVYNHHEQASIFSAIGYYKSSTKIPVVFTTAGCGVTNTITGIMDCWQDSVPCLILSGQTKSTKTIENYKRSGKNIRHYSGQDVDIVELVRSITKYSKEITHHDTEEDIRKILCEAIYHLLTPRFGPVLLSIPLNIQTIDISNHDEIFNDIYEIIKNERSKITDIQDNRVLYDSLYDSFKEKLKFSVKPLILVGGGVKSSKSCELFKLFIEKYKIPIVTTYSAIDILPTDNCLYMGRPGIYGDRCGNLTIQKCDLLIIIGSRASETTLGYNEHLFNSCNKILIDIDDDVLKIDTIKIDLFIRQDIHSFLRNIPDYDYEASNEWLTICKKWKLTHFFDKPIIIPSTTHINPYDFFQEFSRLMPIESTIIPAAGSIFYVTRHMLEIKEKTKVVMFSQQDLGYELPASIGAYFAGNKNIYCFNGDGSIQFNIQELQTIVQHNIPVKIIIFNNHKYGCIEVTQNVYFGKKYGVDKDTGLSFPSFEKISFAYGIDYLYVNTIDKIKNIFDVKYDKNPVIIEIEAEYQDRYPKLGVYINENGEKVPTPFDKMNPQIE